ncbi:MAG: flagellar biosynthetic protein FliP, partial [Pseudomonadota bacterium]
MRLCLLVTIVLLGLAGGAQAQELTLDLGDRVTLTERSIQLIVLLTVLSLVPGLAIMFTCFPFMVTVLGILRQGIGLQQSPPNMLIVSLALFLTYFVMEPVFTEAWQTGLSPMVEGTLEVEEGIANTISPFRDFMISRVDPTTVSVLSDLRPQTTGMPVSDVPLSVLVPSFLLSEIERAFQIGFLVFIPFLII